MSVPSLRLLALESVANYIHDGFYDQTNCVLEPKMSNEIWELFSRRYGCDSNILKQVESKMAVTKIQLGGKSMFQPMVQMLRKKSLESLAFDGFEFLKNKKLKLATTDFLLALKKVVGKESKKNLKYLDLNFSPTTSRSWSQWVSENLPKLETLILRNLVLSKNDLNILGRSLPRLKSLEFFATDIGSLEGLSKLKNLETLSLKNCTLSKARLLNPLFECKKLRMLDLKSTDDGNIIEKFIQCGKVLPELRFLDAAGTDIDKEKLEMLMKTHKNLKQVVVIRTILEYSTIPGIELLNYATPQSFIKCMRHYTRMKHDILVSYLLFRMFYDFDEEETEQLGQEALRGFLSVVCRALEAFSDVEEIYVRGVRCLKIIADEQHLNSLGSEHLLRLANQLMDTGIRWLEDKSICGTTTNVWNIINQVTILSLTHLNVPKVCSFAVRCSKLEDVDVVPALNMLAPRINPLELVAPRSDYLEPLVLWLYYPTPKKILHRKELENALNTIQKITEGNEAASETFVALKRMFLGIPRVSWMLNDPVNMMNILEGSSTLIKRVQLAFYFMEILGEFEDQELVGQIQQVFKDLNNLPGRIKRRLPKFSFCSSYESLKDTVENSKSDGPVEWALWTMREMIKNDKEAKLKFRRCGLNSAVKKLRRKDNKALMDLRSEVLKR
ncbi:hypothetical protein L3Y34_005307 [Caenorhabditis briggsae]|uniref:Uncharacterized protein n=1 Tax=Caenorhabditis briggsae TaxID=6238 RepID=A0AAE9D633_CAEBR|nr:hypothetical protein L3Y34_005307 [Caenorhabditis briggsae]